MHDKRVMGLWGLLLPILLVAAMQQVANARNSQDNPLANVYHPWRLEVIKDQMTATGTVMVVRHEEDGDYHFNLKLPKSEAGLLNERNYSGEGGGLVCEIVPADEADCPVGQAPRPTHGNYNYGRGTGRDLQPPAVGQVVAVTGPYVLDTDHGWMEIHPVAAIHMLGSAPIDDIAPGSGQSVAPSASDRNQDQVNSAQDPMVWVNTRSGIYHYPGTRWYGRTKSGEYLRESKARKEGFRAAENGE